MNTLTTMLLVAGLGLVGGTTGLLGQLSADDHQRSTAPISGRYEIVQSEIAARFLYRLDKFTGQVHVMVQSGSGKLVWQEQRVLDRPSEITDTPRFQIHLSQFTASQSFLIDTVSGQSWNLVKLQKSETEEGEDVWEPIGATYLRK